MVTGRASFICLRSLHNTEEAYIVGDTVGLHLITTAISVTIGLLAEARNPGPVIPPLNGKLNIRIDGIEVHVATLPGWLLP